MYLIWSSLDMVKEALTVSADSADAVFATTEAMV